MQKRKKEKFPLLWDRSAMQKYACQNLPAIFALRFFYQGKIIYFPGKNCRAGKFFNDQQAKIHIYAIFIN